MFQLKNVIYKDILQIEQLEIRARQIACVVGPSGSGKSTLLRLLNHLASPDSGSITYKGNELADLDPISLRREVVMLQQNPVIFPGTIKDNLVIGCRFADKQDPSEADLEASLQYVSLPKQLNQEAGSLSGGETQRLALARILLMRPSVLLLDEPSSALDEENEQAIFRLLSSYCKEEQRTLVMVTHSRTVAAAYADVIITLSSGSVTKVEELTHE